MWEGGPTTRPELGDKEKPQFSEERGNGLRIKDCDLVIES